jgi:hypothetical protein
LAREIISGREASTVCRCTPLVSEQSSAAREACTCARKTCTSARDSSASDPAIRRTGGARRFHQGSSRRHRPESEVLPRLALGPVGRQGLHDADEGSLEQTVTSRRGDDLFAAGTQDRYLLNQTLATHMKTFGQFAASYRCSELPHPRDNPASQFVGGSCPGVPEGFVRQ